MRNKSLHVRVDDEEKHAVQQAALKEKRTVSDWARLLFREATGLDGPTPEGETND